jgi:hypothetical protein
MHLDSINIIIIKINYIDTLVLYQMITQCLQQNKHNTYQNNILMLH